MNTPTLAQALAQAHTLGLARIDAQLLLLHALGRPDAGRAWLLAHDTDGLDDAVQAQFIALCQRRVAGEPVAYLTGRKEFYGLALQVDARVLDPRPDTETLVDWALELIAPLPAPRLADLGTGSGAIALALQSQRPTAQVLAVDASSDALAVAQANATRLGLPVHFRQGNWMAGLDSVVFDAIVSNPPYIAAEDPHLAALTHEPLQALASGADGLEDIRTIVAQAPAHLVAGGWLLLEHGYDQAEAVRALLTDQGFGQVQSRNDLAGIARCTGGCR
ncbi:protein-(glutamine-N5) methyltransferase, release factor-specific [Acidovorax sp. Leaf76]|uniref:peptide chain release factor N(5)-glutamine methyltransferase n=1 Tax=unclassified Acidovorax TaxID=2684926 RepID=UPI0006F2D910|nr:MULTISPECIES: peptide chain release factor N(5)-glutamine methyltransferase [unclassified Acidovorax]KQO21986.1 protein-(glutamine-N5) methyltransferase, release factor-specific [Acidovorax sp. Leaf76]KQO35056.1 protein-(glutamine-N5) methyltransferase, release factor-specific [Acidovorax sp. Leaf84]KQS34840.1 protein-(glutamine-N5) methyltransferase, release factor-specific [Acidovorax sp. Leaf191]